MKKFIAFGDVHFENLYLNIVLNFMKVFKPDVIIIAGDFFDFFYISKYEKEKRTVYGIEKCIKETLKECEWGRKRLNEINNLFPKAKKIFIKGNHEERFDKFFKDEFPQKSENTLEDQLKDVLKGWEVIQLGGFYKLGKLYFMHGEKFNGDLFAKNACLKLRKNVRIWHHHTNQSYTISSSLDGKDLYECKAIGCLCTKNPHYLKGLTNRWINSFLVGYVMQDGYFNDYVVNIINKKILWEGKIIK